MQAFREGVGARFGLPAERWMLELGAFFMRTETELIIKSRRVIPARLIREGYEFLFGDFKSAVNHSVGTGHEQGMFQCGASALEQF